MDDPYANIVRPRDVPVRRVWAREDLNFTPWLSANLDWLTILGMGDLVLEGTEVPVPAWNRNLDILARTSDGRRVAIENQYVEADHDHQTRGLAYAVGLEAKALVIIAENHRPEFLAVADYLNRAQEQMGEDGIAIFMVNLTVEGVADYLVPRFSVVAQPNAWRGAVHRAGESKFTSDADFLAACQPQVQDRMREIVASWTRRPGTSTNTGMGSLSLNIRHPFKAGHPVNSIYLLYTNGNVVIQRGYYLDSGAFPDSAAVQVLDEQIRARFPDVPWRGKNYYLTASEPDPDALAGFADWLLTYFEDQAR